MLVREIILENFMSYEYARIPLKPGLNVICGPNGSGKSSILIAISVALGQTHTERSRKLSDLIRWGKDSARVSLVFDNKVQGGKRPVTKFNVDYFRISRYLKKDGDYWFEANFQTVSKGEIIGILREFGLDPDNMLIIMQQNTMEEFGLTSANQKLVLFEEAIGLAKYRQNVIEASQRLSKVLSEEESINNLLNSAEQTLNYWKYEYDRYLSRKELLRRKNLLERKFIWAQILKQEMVIKSWRERVNNKENELERMRLKIVETNDAIKKLDQNLNASQYEHRKAFYSLINLEKEKTEHETVIRIQTETLQKFTTLEQLLNTVNITSSTLTDFKNYSDRVSSIVVSSKLRLKEVERRITKTQVELSQIEEKIHSITKTYLNTSVEKGLLEFQMKIVVKELDVVNSELLASQRELEQLKPLANKAGLRIETNLSPQEVAEEIKMTNMKLISIGEVSGDIEKMYLSYLKLFTELKQKAAIVSENRMKTLREIDERKRKWRRLILAVLDEVNVTYRKFLSRIGANGSLRLINTQDIETAGLELIVGFKGVEPKILDSYTQSGGERSSATMSFLLALQQHLKSPFRAIDEFDVHMDPRNREVVSDMLLREIGGNIEVQYLAITPGQVTTIEKNVNVITVQNVLGRSEVTVMA